jgi:hypothetical protein
VTAKDRFTSDFTLLGWFRFHPADTTAKRKAHEIVRLLHYELALEMNKLLPEGPDKTIALRAIQEAAMKANACLAVHGGPPDGYIFDDNLDTRPIS